VVRLAAVAEEAVGKMKSSFFFLFIFVLISACQTTSKSSKDVQSDLEAYIGKKIVYDLTAISAQEKTKEVVYFEYNVNLYHEAPLDMSFVNVLKSFIYEANIHLQTTSNFTGKLILPISGIIWEGNSNLFIRMISKTETKTWDFTSIDDFLLAYNGKIVNSINGQSRIELENFPQQTELEFNLTTRTTNTPYIIEVPFSSNSHFRKISVKTNLSGFSQGVQWKTNISLAFSDSKQLSALSGNENVENPKIGKWSEGKEIASAVNFELSEPSLTIYLMNTADPEITSENDMIGMQVHSLFDVKKEITKSDYEKLVNDTFLRMRLNKEKRTELTKKTEIEVISFISNEINNLAETEYLKLYFTDFDLKYNFETIKIVLKEFLYDSIGLKDIVFGFSWNPETKIIRLLDSSTFRTNKSPEFIDQDFDLKFKPSKKK